MDLIKLFLEFPTVCTDTRQIKEGSLFFALKGESFNGNTFAPKALELGSAYAIIDEPSNAENPRLILVDDVLTALQDLARAYRQMFDIPMLAITGSNGKTTTKELVREVVAKNFKVHATKGNFNNHIGVPLTLLSMPRDTQFAIIEMGANHEHEIEMLCEIALPDYGMITNIGEAHLEGFGDINGVIRGKGELYEHLRKHEGVAFVNMDMEYLPSMAQGLRSLSFGQSCEIFQLDANTNGNKVVFGAQLGEDKFQVKTNLTGLYNLANFASAIAVGLHFGIRGTDICEAISNYVPDNQRSQITKTARNTLILDAYNANPSSMIEALRNLHAIAPDSGYFILGDMFELGTQSKQRHQDITDLSTELGLSGIFVGETFAESRTDQKKFRTKEELTAYLRENQISNQTVLIKGSRGMRLEELLDLL
jgi:UDP-N-acetylmuramoyl-tripeptide--D-alanyl-D-alanine ligase